MRITCIATPTSSMGQYAIVYNMAAWPERTLKARGWLNARVVYERQATEYESLENSESKRYLAFRYDSWAEVLADKAKYGIDADRCRTLLVVEDLDVVTIAGAEDLRKAA